MTPPPQDLAAERSVLGAVLLEPARFVEAAAIVTAADFYRRAHQHIWNAYAQLAGANVPIDLVTVRASLEAAAHLDDAPMLYLSELVGAVPRSTNIAAHASIVREKSRARVTLAALDRARTAIAADGATPEIINGLSSVLATACTLGNEKKAAVVPRITTVADVAPQPVEWIWPGRIAVGKLTIVSGDPGLGKSFATMDWAARISSGRPWPDGASSGPPAAVLLMTAEDAIDDTIRPRLDAAGADVRLVHVLTCVQAGDRERSVTLGDLAAIELAIETTDAKAVVIDPMTAYLAGTDSHRDADVRGLLAPLAALADRRRVAIVAVMHLNKLQGQRAIYRAGGSIAFTAAARIVLAVAADPEQDGRRILASVKSNLAVEPAALAYRITEGRVVWEDQPVSAVDVDALLSPAPVAHAEDRTAAEDLIAELLQDHDAWPLEAKTAEQTAAAHGIHFRTLQRAARKAGIRAERLGFGTRGRWMWRRPIDDTGDNDHAGHFPLSSMENVSPMAIGVDLERPIGDIDAIGDTKNLVSPMDANPFNSRAAFGSEEADRADRY